MKVKTFIEESFLSKDNLDKVDSPHCYCPANGRNVDCSRICVKCKHFRWFNEDSISCTYGQHTQLTFSKKEIYAKEYHLNTNIPKNEI